MRHAVSSVVSMTDYPDLPFEEQGELKAVLAKNEASPILIQLVSPVSKAACANAS